MGNVFAKCLAAPPPPVVFTICPIDGKAHEFDGPANAIDKSAACKKCGKLRQVIDTEARACQMGDHEWVQDFVPVCVPVVAAQKETSDKAAPAGGPIAQGTPVPAQGAVVQPVYKCMRCGLRQQMDANGAYMYDDYCACPVERVATLTDRAPAEAFVDVRAAMSRHVWRRLHDGARDGHDVRHHGRC